MAKKSIGLKSIKMGAIAVDGGMGTVLTQVGATVSDTAALTTEEGTKTDFNIEESDAPFFSIESAPGRKVLAWSSYDVDLDTLSRFWGGTVAAASGGNGRSWEMPDTLPVIERSIEIETKDGWKIQIPRLSLTAKLQWNLQKTKLAQIDLEGVILKPEKAGVSATKFIEPVA
ncbi:MAG TPA: hypothetical protein VEZ55_06955 [Chitinophagaceae bacterium]|nr:hypothetical protein [Chitinophagaceae bacterium]